jgi:hypothetical protein
MTRDQLQAFFVQPYDQAAWLKTIHGIFPHTEVFSQPQPVSVGDSRAQSVLQLGNTRLADDRGLAILEVAVNETTDLVRNRVGLRNLVTRFIDQDKHHGVLAVFRSPQPTYRFTFVGREMAMDEAGQIVKRETAPRRFTYLLGPGESCRTAAERFSELARKGNHAALRDLTDAFSVEKLNKEFFADYCRVFQRVRQDIAARHPRWSKEIVEQQTQTLLNRLLFLCFVQRKGWLNRQRDYLVQNFRQHFNQSPNGSSYLDKFLRPVFEKLSTESAVADIAEHDLPFLNGGLFSDEYGAEQSDETLRRHKQLKVGNATFQHVFDDLLEIYNFTIREDSPTDQEVAIDPEMLGKIFESLVLQIEKSDGGTESLRHDTGSHYTPRPIVHYLCTEGLRGWLEQFPPDPKRAATWPQRLEKLLAIDASDGIDEAERAILDDCLSPEEAKALLDRLETLRACDPAVGSGAFPVGLLHELVNLMRLCETRSRGKDPVTRDSNWLYDTKSAIIRRVIYGVDIQERAVEICKLRLWLSLMVDFDIGVDVDNCSRSAFRAALKNITPLPNLDYKIRRADSLIDRVCGHPVILPRSLQDASGFNDALNKLSSAKLAFYSAHSQRDKRKHHFDILAATADLALNVFKQSKLDLKGSLIPHDDDLQRLRELEQPGTDMLAIQGQIRAARKLPAAQQDDELQRITGHFDDPAKPTFVWQLDFAEVFHRKDASGFDFMVGNPPYVRIQALRQSSQDVVGQLKERYVSARKGNYDLYVPFVERGLNLLQNHGQLAYILPHKFFNAQYGEPLRDLLAKGRNLRHVVHFGDQQIFPGATNYVCLLFLDKAGADSCRFVRPDNLDVWLATTSATEGRLPATRITAAEWNFAVGSGAGLFDKLQRFPVKLGTVAHIFVGLQTSADPIFILRLLKRTSKRTLVYSKALESEFELENVLLKPLLKGAEIHRYRLDEAANVILFPYRIEQNAPQLLSREEMREKAPLVWEYLLKARKLLEARENGRWKVAEWWQFGRNQNIAEMHKPKLVTQVLAKQASYFWDDEGKYCFVGGGNAGGYGIQIKDNRGVSDLYLLGLLNSLLLDYVLKRISTPFRGGFFSYARRFIEQLPIRPINFADAAERAEHDAVVGLVERVLAAKRTDAQANVAALEQEIDDRVYRLYGLTKDEIKLVEESSRKG